MTKINETGKPIPAGNALDEQYWSYAANGELRFQRCQNCQTYYRPPTGRCFVCGGEDLAFEAVSGKGTIYSFTITHDARNPAFASIQPYAVVWVELDEQPRLRLISNMPDTPLEQVRVGARVEVFFEKLTEYVGLPLFRLVD